MTQSEYIEAVYKQLEAEGFKITRRETRQRFFAVDSKGVKYEFRIKYCVKPRKLEITDIGYMTGLMSNDAINVLVTNGTDITRFVEKRFKDDKVQVVLNWMPDNEIINQLHSVN